jgi:glycosyltransferase involved in cell wall biosynthesis
MKTKLTIAILTYNRANYLKYQLESIKTQTYPYFTAIIYDNCSTDNTKKVVQPYLDDERFSYYKHSENIGHIKTINYALLHCSTEYLLITHDDDIMLPEMIKREISILESDSNLSLVSVNANYINPDNEIISKAILNFITMHDTTIQSREFINYIIQFKNIIMCPTVMFRMSFIKEHKLFFNEDILGTVVVFFWLELNQLNYSFYYISEVLYHYRIHNDQGSHNSVMLLPPLKKPVFELLKQNNYPDAIINKWLKFINMHLYNELLKCNNAHSIVNTIKDDIFIGKKDNIFFFISIFILCYQT